MEQNICRLCDIRENQIAIDKPDGFVEIVSINLVQSSAI